METLNIKLKEFHHMHVCCKYLNLKRDPIRKKFCRAFGPFTGPRNLKNA